METATKIATSMVLKYGMSEKVSNLFGFGVFYSLLWNYVLSVLSQRKHTFYYQNTLLDAFRTYSRNVIGRNPSMVIPLLANQDLTPMLD